MGESQRMLNTVSAAMAVYNGERYLAEQIDSILAQLDEKDELVISYDKSSDATLDIVQSYAGSDDRVKVVFNEHPGVVGNFNNAIAACEKDVIFISDQDDVWVAGKRDRMVSVLNETGADLAIHNAVHINGEGLIISNPLFEEYNIGGGILRNFAVPRYSGCCMAFPSESRQIIMPMPTEVVNYDHWIGMACEVFGEVVFVEDILLEHRLHGSNVTTSRRPLKVIAAQRFNLLRALVQRGRRL